MTLAELQAETLVEKNLRLRRAKCNHEEIFSSGCIGPSGSFTEACCLDCGMAWRSERPAHVASKA